jgi:riboflavin synthase
VFTGIVEEVGGVRAAARARDVVRLDVAAKTVLEGSEPGASVAVNGVCLTVVERGSDGLTFEIGPETLARTTFGHLRAGDAVNLERPLRFGGALGGHLVLGHVDGTATVQAVSRVESTARVTVALGDESLAALLIPQGSVALDGVSLTVAALEGAVFEVMLIPHTLAVTTLGRLAPAQMVNVETDMIGKYVQRAMAVTGANLPRGGRP